MRSTEQLAGLIQALDSEHRRSLLDALRTRDGQSVGELSAGLPQLSRHAVMKHVRILEESGAVTTAKVGRSRLVFINAAAIVTLATRWLDDYSMLTGMALVGLRDHLEGDPRRKTMNEASTRTIVTSIVIGATPERVWKALTDPEETDKWFFGTTVRSTWEVGSEISWVDADGAPQISGRITACEPGQYLCHSFSAVWSPETAKDAASRYEWQLESLGEGLTRLTVTHSGIPAGTSTAEQVEGGASLVVSALKTFVETGDSLPGMGA